MNFDNDYWNAMDKDPKSKEYSVSGSEFGISHGIGDVSQGLKANVFAGASQVELGFFGQGKGSRSQATSVTPEVYGKTEREDMRQLAKINEVQLSTHAAATIPNLTGLGEKGFSESQRENTLLEVKRAVDFAAETAGGGSVTVHTGEFPRSIKEKFGKEGFSQYPGEEKEMVYHLVNEKTGQISQQVKADQIAYIPEYELDKNGEPRLDSKGYPIPKFDKNGDVIIKERKFSDFRDDYLKKYPTKNAYHAAQDFAKELGQHEIEQARGQANEYEVLYKRHKAYRDEAQKVLKAFEHRQLKENQKDIDPRTGRNTSINELRDEVKDHEKEMTYGQETAIGARRNILRLDKDLSEIIPIEQYGLQKSTDSIAKAAIYAYDREKSEKLKRPYL